MNNKNIDISIIIPVYNEINTVKQVIEKIKIIINRINHLSFEIIVIDDFSVDGSSDIINIIDDIIYLKNTHKKGYGGSLKTGASLSQGEYLLFIDADGQHNPDYIFEFLQDYKKYDMILGNRIIKYKEVKRLYGRTLLKIIAELLVEKKIKDINCGFRLIRKKLLHKYEFLLPNGFSLSTTLTLLAFKENWQIKFIDLETIQREGASSMNILKDGLRTFLLIMRIIILFNPMKIFIPISIVLFFTGTLFSLQKYIFFTSGTTLAVILIIYINSLIIFMFGLIADQLSTLILKK